ncbi:ATP-binding protein [Streptomyces sp. NPDC050439]|uniref:ATP-binding protein n=1 Tax=unclassified Streptomyces TaxID=2593676 RepID=UPI003434F138
MNHVTPPPPLPVRGTYRMSLTLGEHSARHLRFILRAYLGSWGMGELRDCAELALTELGTNVVRHVPDRRCDLLILRRPQGLRVEVADRCPRLPRQGGGGGEELDEGGRGLLIVEAVTDRCGFEPWADGAGKTAWFECDAKGDGTCDAADAGPTRSA